MERWKYEREGGKGIEGRRKEGKGGRKERNQDIDKSGRAKECVITRWMKGEGEGEKEEERKGRRKGRSEGGREKGREGSTILMEVGAKKLGDGAFILQKDRQLKGERVGSMRDASPEGEG